MFIVKYELIIINNVYCWLQMWKHSPWELTDSLFCKISCLQSLKISLYWSNLIKQRMVEIDGDTDGKFLAYLSTTAIEWRGRQSGYI